MKTDDSSITAALIQVLSLNQKHRGLRLAVLLVALFQMVYGAAFIYRSSFVVEGKRYFCLFDDAMISMRYADNWANGHGFVWNIGEQVEGYTNFGWTFIMGLCHLLGLSPSHTCLLVQILGIPILWFCLFATVKLARACRLSAIAAGCAVIIVGMHYNLIFFTLFGMETGLVAGLVTLALAGGVQAIRRSAGSMTPMLWFAPATLIRYDVLVFLLIVFFYLLLKVRRGRIRLVAGLGVVLLVVAMHFLWRHHFCGQWLPNTYYLKATGWPLLDRLVPGISQTLKTLLGLSIPILFALVAMLIAPRKGFALPALCFLGGLIYQLYVGGDAWPLDRFVLPGVIGLLVLAAEEFIAQQSLWPGTGPIFTAQAFE